MIMVISLIFLSVFLFSFSIFYMASNKERPIDKIKDYDNNYFHEEKYKNEKGVSILKKLSQLIPNLKFNEARVLKIERELIMSDLPITYEELLIIKILLSTSLSFLSFAISKDIFIAIVIFISIWNVPGFYIRLKKNERIKLFDDELNEGIMIISNSLKAGYSFLQAISVVCEETKDPFAKEFKKLLKEMSLGIPEKDALTNLLKRVGSDNLKLVITAILIQKDTGGNLSEILDNIGETIRDRQKIKDELKTLTAQGKLSGTIVTLMPVFLGGIIYLFNKEYVILLFTTKIGLGMVIGTVFSEFLGFLFIRKIVNIDI